MNRETNFIKRLQEERGNDYTLLGTYTKMRQKTKFRHEVCGYEWDVKPNNLVGARGIEGCPHCANRNKSKTNAEINHQLRELEGGPFELAEGEIYQNQYTKLKMKHKTCGHVFKATTGTIISNQSCPYCFESERGWQGKTTGEFNSDLKKERGKEYTVVEGSEYRGANEKIKIRHTDCGHEWDVRAAHILYRSGCPKCNKSKGEEFIAGELTSRRIKYSTQHTFPDCINHKELPFDFAVLNNDGSLNVLIEYDGIQHYKPFKHFGGVAKFNKQKVNDKIKDDYCKDNDITLIRIPYTKTEEEIKNVLTSISQEVT